MNRTDFIKEYVNGLDNGEFNNVKIVNGIFYHFSTPIIERFGDKYILNVTIYSDQTRFLQRKIKSIIPSDMIIEVNKVVLNYRGSLKQFIK